MSMDVVTKGPVATAGSTPALNKRIGIIVPTAVAITMEAHMDTPTTRLREGLPVMDSLIEL